MAEHIDRDKLVAKLCERCALHCDIKTEHCKIVGEIMMQTPADVVEVVHGRWIISQRFEEILEMEVVKYTCSACNEYRLSATGLSQATNYCPACGARMDGE